MSIIKKIESLLRTREEFSSADGEILSNKVYDAAVELSPELLDILMSDDEIKGYFFSQTSNGTWVFNQQKFEWAITNNRFLEDSYTHYKNVIGLADASEKRFSKQGEVILIFPYKDCTLEGGQTKQERIVNREVFFNKTIAPDEIKTLLEPKVITRATRYDGDHPDGMAIKEISPDDNLIIRGNNLMALSSLSAINRYRGKVKLIYIDPPYFFTKPKEYDTFKYNSNFHLSTWLVFMKDRLELAKKMLLEGGTIWISIGEDGMHYLKVLADEIFGVENFVATLPRRARFGKGDVPYNLSQDFDWVLVYTNVSDDKSVVGRKTQKTYYTTPDFPGRPWRTADLTTQKNATERPNSYFPLVNPKDGKEYPASRTRTWAVTKDTWRGYYDQGGIIFPGDYDFLNITVPYARKFKDEDDAKNKLSSIISDIQIKDFLTVLLSGCPNRLGTKESEDLFGIGEFDYAKPENLIKSILEVATDEGDLVMDFFLGSGTTCAVAHKMNRRYIGVDQMDYIERLAVNRLRQVIDGEQGGVSAQVKWMGGGSFVYCQLATLNQDFVFRIEDKGQSPADILKDMMQTGYMNHTLDLRRVEGKIDNFHSLTNEEQRAALMEMLDVNMLYKNVCDMDDEDMSVSEEDKALNRNFYGLKE